MSMAECKDVEILLISTCTKYPQLCKFLIKRKYDAHEASKQS